MYEVFSIGIIYSLCHTLIMLYIVLHVHYITCTLYYMYIVLHVHYITCTHYKLYVQLKVQQMFVFYSCFHGNVNSWFVYSSFISFRLSLLKENQALSKVHWILRFLFVSVSLSVQQMFVFYSCFHGNVNSWFVYSSFISFRLSLLKENQALPKVHWILRFLFVSVSLSVSVFCLSFSLIFTNPFFIVIKMEGRS